ncbi:hypothetical protein SAMN05444411_1353 [Lutibacter oricola]|uniref:Lipoprotein n=1 Tax=Lutibacter oricola TaxID=762486 RepID=A0A1H3HE33_9FLAO|nr:hypothetical protein [Lutibacter oricola]SDY13776.1 hypothetical protein SAMN05444411_1353 [Lutibacter oricola]
MKRIASLLILIFTIISCNPKTEVVEGDLYFQIIDFTNFHQATNDQLEELDKHIDSLRLSKMITEEDLEYIGFYDQVKKHNLLRKPLIRIKSDTLIRRIYLTESEFKKVKNYKWSDLGKRKKKVKIKIEIRELDEDIYFSDKIIDYQEIEK